MTTMNIKPAANLLTEHAARAVLDCAESGTREKARAAASVNGHAVALLDLGVPPDDVVEGIVEQSRVMFRTSGTPSPDDLEGFVRGILAAILKSAGEAR